MHKIVLALLLLTAILCFQVDVILGKESRVLADAEMEEESFAIQLAG